MKVTAIDLETEKHPLWEGQSTQGEIFEFLARIGYTLASYELLEDGVQANSFWILEEKIARKHTSEHHNA